MALEDHLSVERATLGCVGQFFDNCVLCLLIKFVNYRVVEVSVGGTIITRAKHFNQMLKSRIIHHSIRLHIFRYELTQSFRYGFRRV